MSSTLDLLRYIARDDISVIEAMRKIDINAKGILYIVDRYGHMVGSVTDGDIRRWIIDTADLTSHVSEMVFKDTKFILQGHENECRRLMKEYLIHSVPVLNENHEIVDIIFENINNLEYINREDLKETAIIIMAGGKGTRLQPYTHILPKPLIPIGNIPILERIVDRFYIYGAREFYITVNYKKNMIKSYFSELNKDYKIKFIEEDEPLGTAGSIRLIDKSFVKPVIVTNCDILIEAEYDRVIEYHNNSGNDVTIVSSLKNMSIPYGVLQTKEHGIITAMEEKPEFSYFINTGMYIINPEFLEWIPQDTFYHMPQLISEMMDKGKKVGMYPISERSFLDMGEFEELKKMEERISGESND